MFVRYFFLFVFVLCSFSSLASELTVGSMYSFGNKNYAVSGENVSYNDLSSITFPDGFSLVSFSSLSQEEKDFIKKSFSSYKYFYLKDGLYDLFNGSLCSDVDDLFFDCSGQYVSKDSKHKVLMFSIVPDSSTTSSDFLSGFCRKRCYDGRADVSPQTHWDTSNSSVSVTLNMKKGFYIVGYIRPYGNGCFVDGSKLKVCVNSGNLELSFVHSNGFTYSVSAPVQMKYWNSFRLGVSPNMVSIFVRQHGTDSAVFNYKDLDYLPIDNDDSKFSYSVPVTFKRLSSDPYEYISFDVVQGGTNVPFCGEQIAACYYNQAFVHSYVEDGKIMFGAHFSKAILKGTLGISYYYRNGNFETQYNIGDMFVPTSSDPIRAGVVREWRTGNNVDWGFTQKKTENNIVEEFGFGIDVNTLKPYRIGVFRDKSEYGKLYLGFDSDRKSNWLPASVINAFFKDEGNLLMSYDPSDPNKVLTTDGLFEKKYSLCPLGQVELYSGRGLNYEGNCFTYLYDAYCVDSTVGGYDQDRIGDYCYLQQPRNPDICPSDGRSYTLLTPPSYNYVCQTTKSPSCSNSSLLRIGGSCYTTAVPKCPLPNGVLSDGTCTGYQPVSCPSGYTFDSSRNACIKTTSAFCPSGYVSYGTQCLKTTRDYSDYSYPVSYNYTCSSNPSIVGTRYAAGRCSNNYPYSFATFYYVNSDGTCIEGVSYRTDCGCSSLGASPPSSCLSSKSCPSGYYYDSSSDSCISSVSPVCPSGYSYDYSSKKCVRVISSCSYEAIGLNGYSYDNANNICVSYYEDACNNSLDSYRDWGYDSSKDVCYHNQYAECYSPAKRFIDPDTGYYACYLERPPVSPPSGNGVDNGVYCKSGDYYWNKRCYRKEGLACQGNYDYSHTNQIVIGSSNSFGEWTGYCWNKIGDVCSSGAYPLRGEHTRDIHCLRPVKTFSEIITPTPSQFSFDMCSYLSRFYYGNASCSSGSFSNSYYSFFADFSGSLCPLGNSPCLPIVSDVYLCGTPNKSCAMCTENNPSVVSSNIDFAVFEKVKESNGKRYGLARDFYNWDSVQDILKSTGSVLPSSSELNSIRVLFGLDGSVPLWSSDDTVSKGDSVYSVSYSGSEIILPSSVKSYFYISDIPSSVNYCEGSSCSSVSGIDAILKYVVFKSKDGSLYGFSSSDGVNQLSYQLISSKNSIYVSLPKDVELVSILANSKVSLGSSLKFSISVPSVKRLVVVFGIQFGFLTDCVFGDDYNMLCTADMVECVNGVCPYGDQYACVSYKGRKYCSKYSSYCSSMASSKGGIENNDTPEGANDIKPDGSVDDKGNCSGAFYIFNGSDRRCRPPGSQTYLNDCCSDEYMKLLGLVNIGKCKSDELVLSKMKKSKYGLSRCHYVGDYCAQKISLIGICIQKKKTYCCYNSVLARIIQEQGRQQLGIDWGKPESPNCRGFTVDEFQKIDFSKIDFSEWMNQLISDINANLTNTLQNNINNTLNNVQNSFK